MIILFQQLQQNPNLAGKNAQQPIVNPDLLQEYGQKYLDKVNSIITNPQDGYYGCYEKWAPSLMDRNITSDLEGEKAVEEAKKNGLTMLSDALAQGMDVEP